MTEPTEAAEPTGNPLPTEPADPVEAPVVVPDDHPDPKFRVEMRSVSLAADGTLIEKHATDYVPQSILDAYVADARNKWQAVTVSDEPDFGPGGLDGDTHYPEHLIGGES